MTSRARTYNGVTYVDPNELFGEDNIGVNQEELTKYVNLSVRIPSRYYNNNVKTYDSLLSGTDFTFRREVENENGEIETKYINIPLLSTNYTDISFNDINNGDLYNSEVFGIKSINISFDSQLFPRVDMVFTDVRGFGLMSSNEIVNRTDNTNVKRFFTSLFNFPYPIFTLSVKGYYGGTVSFNLSLLKFETQFESETGNFNVYISFIGDMYGVLGDIPMSYLFIAPYLGASNGETNSYWNSLSTEPQLPTFIELIEKYGTFLKGDYDSDIEENTIAGYIQLMGEIGYLTQLKEYYNELNRLITVGEERMNEEVTQDNYPNISDNIKKLSKTKTIIFLGEGDNTKAKSDIEIIVNGIKNLKIPKKDFSFDYTQYNGISAITRNITGETSIEDSSTSTEGSKKSLTVVILKNFKKCSKNVDDRLEYSTTSFSTDEYVTVINDVLTKVLGMPPNIKNIYNMTIKHLDVFMKYFYDKIININYENVNIPDNIIIDSTNTDDSNTIKELPPFCSFYDKYGGFLIPKNLNFKLIENDIVNDILGTTKIKYKDFEDAKEVVESQRNSSQVVIPNIFLCDYYFQNDYDYIYRCLGRIEKSNVIDRLYKIFINRAKAFVKFYGETGLSEFITLEVKTLLESNHFSDDTIKTILTSGVTYKNDIGEIIDVDNPTLYLNYGGDEKKYAICNQNNNNFLGSVFVLGYGDKNVSVKNSLFDKIPESDETENDLGSISLNYYKNSNDFKNIYCKKGYAVSFEGNVYKYLIDKHTKGIDKHELYFSFNDEGLNPLTNKYSLFDYGGRYYTTYDYKEGGGYTYDKAKSGLTHNVEIYRYTTRQLCTLGEYVDFTKEYVETPNETYSHGLNACLPYMAQKVTDDYTSFKYYSDIETDECIKEFVSNIRHLEKWKYVEIGNNTEYENPLQNLMPDSGYTGITPPSNQDILDASVYDINDKYKGYVTDKDIEEFKQNNNDVYHILPILCKNYFDVDISNLVSKKGVTDEKPLEEYNFLLAFNRQENECSIETLENALDAFINKISEETGVDTTIFSKMTTDETNALDDELKNNIYYNLKSLYDKWLCGLRYNDFKYGGVLTNNLHCITPLHEDNSNSICDVDKLYKEIDDIITNKKRGVSVINFLSDIAQQNNMLFLTQPSNTEENFEDFFSPNVLPKINEESFPHFYFISQGQVSHNLNIPNSEFKDDGIYFNTETNEFNTFDLSNINVFGVSYGIQNQNFFKKVGINTQNPIETEDSIANLFEISNRGENESASNVFINSASLYPIYSKRSYTCTVEMMGCMNIMPLTYFQLNNIPLFNGAYMIIDVKHSITPNDFSTTVTGVRVSRYKVPTDSRIYNLPLSNMLISKYMNVDVNQSEFLSEVTRLNSQLTPPTTIDPNEVNIDQYGIHWKAYNSSEGAMAKNVTVPEGREGYDDCWRTGIGIILSHSGVTPDYEYNVENSFTWDNDYYVGDKNNIIKLLYEKDYKENNKKKRCLYYDESGVDTISDGFNNKIESKYAQAISCIEHHINNNCPIMVGVNHTIDKGINEGATDHFVVIYAYGNFDDGKKYYRYYETGSNNTTNGFTGTAERVNYFIYDTNNGKPLLYNPKSYRTKNRRFDVTQVRPYISRTDNSNWLYIVKQSDTPSGDTILEK